MNDGTKYKVLYPAYDVCDAITSNKLLKYTDIQDEPCFIHDQTNNLKCFIEFPKRKSSFFSAFSSSKDDEEVTVHAKNLCK